MADNVTVIPTPVIPSNWKDRPPKYFESGYLLGWRHTFLGHAVIVESTLTHLLEETRCEDNNGFCYGYKQGYCDAHNHIEHEKFLSETRTQSP